MGDKNYEGMVAVIEDRILAITEAERVTKAELGALSREVLFLLVVEEQHQYVGMVNRLLDVLTPVNHRAACLYFDAFLPWKFEPKAKKFTTMYAGEKKRAKYYDKCVNFLEDENANIWTWTSENVEMKAPKPFAERIQNVVKQALNGIEDREDREGLPPLQPADIMRAVLSVEGMTVEDAMKVLEENPEVPEDMQDGKAQAA